MAVAHSPVDGVKWGCLRQKLRRESLERMLGLLLEHLPVINGRNGKGTARQSPSHSAFPEQQRIVSPAVLIPERWGAYACACAAYLRSMPQICDFNQKRKKEKT